MIEVAAGILLALLILAMLRALGRLIPFLILLFIIGWLMHALGVAS